MPTYVYQVIREDDESGEIFEVVQSMRDDPLTHHPETGEPVRRVIQPPYIPGAMSDHVASRTANDDKRLGELGFTKYVKAGDGHYEKTAGKGPSTLDAGD